jgi:hypothetical protein
LDWKERGRGRARGKNVVVGGRVTAFGNPGGLTGQRKRGPEIGYVGGHRRVVV